MKKLLLLSVVGVFSLSSFASKTEEKEVLKESYTCANGSTGTFICPCSQADAQYLAHYYCQ